MNTINVSINFKERKCNVEGVTLTEGDYNSTKMVFDYDVEEGIKVLEMKNRLGEIVYFDEIVDNEVVLVGKAQVIKIENNIKYYKYTDANEAVFWYDKENNKLYDDEMVEVIDFNLDDYEPVLVDASLFTIDGEYTFEVSLYENDSKLTSAYGTIDVAPEQVVFDETQVELIAPILDNLINKCNEIQEDIATIKDDIIDLDNNKQDTLVSGENIKTINGKSVLGSGNIEIDQDFVKDPNYVHTDNNYTTEEKTKLAGLENYDDTEIKEDIVDLQTNKADKSELPDVSEFITKDVDNLTNYTTTNDMNTAINNAVGIETTNRQNSDVALQNQIDAITSSSDVVDVVSTYQDLLDYDTSKLTDKDVIKVMQDSTHSNAISYYRWNTSTFDYVGSEGPFYTKSETDTLLNNKVGFTDYAKSDKGGVIRVGENGLSLNNNYRLQAGVASYSDYAAKSSTYFIGKGTLENVITGKGLVSNTDYATTSKAGVIKLDNSYGVNVSSSSGNIYSATKDYAWYSTANNGLFIGKGTLENVITGKELTNKTYVDAENATQDTQIEALQEENNYLNSIIDQLPKVSGEGEYITLNNTIEGKMSLELGSSELEQDIPSGYTFVDYIESSGTQYIDIGIKGNENTRVVIDYQVTGAYASGYRLFGSRVNAGNGFFISSDATDTIYVDYAYSASRTTFNPYVRHIIDHSNKTYLDGELLFTFTKSAFTTPNNLILFGGDQNGTISSKAFKIWNCKIYDNDVLIRNLLPCYRNSDNAIGMYDLVNNVFYTNAGTGTFTKGSDINLPTPEIPFDIHTISGDNEIVVEGKNLLNRATCEENKLIRWVQGDTYSETGSLVSDYIRVNIGDNIFCSYSCQKAFYDKDKNYIGVLNGDGTIIPNGINANILSSFVVPNVSNVYYMKLGFRAVYSTGVNLLTANIMVNKGSSLATYQPYQQQVKEINLGNLEYCEIGDYKDEFYKATDSDTGLVSGKWYLKKNIGKVVLDGSENWSAFASVNYEYQLSLFAGLPTDTSNQYFPALCNKYINHNVAGSSLSNYEFSHFSTQPSSQKERFVRFRNNDITTLANWKTELENNNLILYVPLATPTYTILNETLQTQLNNLEKALSYKEQTNISQVNNDLGFTIKASALLDLNSLINS